MEPGQLATPRKAQPNRHAKTPRYIKPSARSRHSEWNLAAGFQPVFKRRSRRPQSPRIHDIAGVESALDRSHRHHSHGRDVVGEPRQVFGAYSVVMRKRGAVIHEGLLHDSL